MSSTPWQSTVKGTTPAWIVDGVRALEDRQRLDGPAARLEAVADTLLPSSAVQEGLRGRWFGHALHPMLTDFPLGAWMSASLLDLIGGRSARGPSRRLIGFGLVVAAPTAAAGLAEWKATGGAARRVGVVHAGVNSTAFVLYGSSWLARRRGRHWRGVLLGVGGGVMATAGGYLGGHLSLVRKVGTADPAFAEGTPG